MLLAVNFDHWNPFSVLITYILNCYDFFFNAFAVDNRVRLLIPAFTADHQKCKIQHERNCDGGKKLYVLDKKWSKAVNTDSAFLLQKVNTLCLKLIII